MEQTSSSSNKRARAAEEEGAPLQGPAPPQAKRFRDILRSIRHNLKPTPAAYEPVYKTVMQAAKAADPELDVASFEVEYMYVNKDEVKGNPEKLLEMAKRITGPQTTADNAAKFLEWHRLGMYKPNAEGTMDEAFWAEKIKSTLRKHLVLDKTRWLTEEKNLYDATKKAAHYNNFDSFRVHLVGDRESPYYKVLERENFWQVVELYKTIGTYGQDHSGFFRYSNDFDKYGNEKPKPTLESVREGQAQDAYDHFLGPIIRKFYNLPQGQPGYELFKLCKVESVPQLVIKFLNEYMHTV